MAGFVKEVTPRLKALEYTAEELFFPWDIRSSDIPLDRALGRRISRSLISEAPYPPFTRSLRDGYAVYSPDVVAATSGTPSFLRKNGDISMGTVPAFGISSGCTAAIPTGGVLPEGADAVVMLEDTTAAGDWIEIRRGVQSGENIISAGEEISSGSKLLGRGDMVDFRSVSVLSALGVKNVPAIDMRISILSTGDEIVPVETAALPPGCVRDANGWSVRALLERHGFSADYAGIVSDDGDSFEKRVMDELEKCDVLVLSGGSSVGIRDHCSQVLEALPAPGLLVRGINIMPGKPALIAGCREDKNLLSAFPGIRCHVLRWPMSF